MPQCPTTTRQTLYGAVTLVCSGHGGCDVSSGNCTCTDGSHWAQWQISPENLQPGPDNGDCHVNDGKATEEQIARHWVYLIALFALEFLLCWWLYGPALPVPGLPPPPDASVHLRPSALPKLTAIITVSTLLATIFGALFAGANCNCYWLADFNRYNTISALAEHPPMTVITPVRLDLTPANFQSSHLSDGPLFD